MKIAIGSDHGGYDLKENIKNHLVEKGYEVTDFGCYNKESCDYPDIAKEAALSVAKGENTFGVLVCGTGIGISIAANKIKGIRCAHCADTYCAHMTRQHNDANMIALGERVTGTGLALDIVDTFLNTEFEGGRHERRVKKIMDLEA